MNWALHWIFLPLSFYLLVSLTGCGPQKEWVSLLANTQDRLNQCEQKSGDLKAKHERLTAHLERVSSDQQDFNEKMQMCIHDLKQLNREYKALRHHQPNGSPSSSSIVTRISYPELEQVVKSVKGTVLRNQGPLVVQFGAVKTQIEFSKKTKILTVASRFKGFTPRIELMNAWNYTKRFSRAYLDRAGEIVLESEIDLESGVTAQYVQNWLRGYGLISNFFLMTLQKAEKGTLMPPSDSQPNESQPKSKKGPQFPSRKEIPPSFKPQEI